MAKMSDRVPNERLGTSRLSHLHVWPHLKKNGSDLTVMQSKIKICKTDFSKTKKMWNEK